MSEKWNAYWKAFVPQKISGAWVAGAMQFGTLFSFVSKRKKEYHKTKNITVLLKESSKLFFGKYIEKQHDWTEVYFGSGKDNTIAHSGCGIIATYNAMAFLEQWEIPQVEKLVELIRYFEGKGSVFGGRLGVAPKAIMRYLKQLGYQTNFYKGKLCVTEKNLNSIGETYQTLIVTFYNHEMDITGKMHTVCVTKEYGRYFVHNAVSFVRNAPKGTGTLTEAVNASATAPKVICVTGVSK